MIVTIGRFPAGRVIAHDFYPRPGQRVSLESLARNLLVYPNPDRGDINYTWPRDPHPNNDSLPFTTQRQAELAIKHYERKTGFVALSERLPEEEA